MGTRRAVAGAVLLDLAVSPLFAWDVFTRPLSRELAVSDTALAGVFSVGLACFMLGVLLGGRAADRVAPRRLAVVVLVGTVAGLVGSAVAPSLPVLYAAFGVLVGGSTGLGYATAVRVAGTVAAGRGLALAVVVSAYAAGTALLAPATSALLDAVGRAATFLVLAVALGTLLGLAAILLPGTAPHPPPGHARPQPSRPTLPVIALWLTFGLGSAPTLAAFAQAGRLVGSPAIAAIAVTLLNIGNFVGRLTAGPLSDRYGRRAALHANAALLLLACAPLAAGASGLLALIALLGLGTQYGALSVLTPAATADVVPVAQYGTTYGLVFTSWGLAGLTAPVAAAALAGQAGYRVIYAAFLVLALLSWAGVAVYTHHGAQEPNNADIA